MKPKVKSDNSWHRTMYDKTFAGLTIGSNGWKDKSKKEARFLMSLLDIPKGAAWLDVPCGTGRHVAEFTRAGYKVTGIDISEDCLSLARKRVKGAIFRRGDMARLKPFHGKFDVVSNLFTSFGYFATDKENFSVLCELVKCLKPGGRLILNTINRDFLLSIYQPARWSESGDWQFVEASKFDPITNYNEAQIAILNKRTGKGKAYYHRVRLYSKPEMVSLMKKAGLSGIEVYGNFDGNRFNKMKSTHPIFIGTKRS